MRRSLYGLVLCAAVTAGAAVAEDETDPYREFRGPNHPNVEFDFDSDKIEKWREAAVDIPVLSEEGLRDIEIDHGPPGLAFQIDMDTLTIHPEDQVIRFWLVMTSNGRRTNIVYEGIDCTEVAYKTYAYASNRRSSLIKPLNDASWREIKGRSSRDYHYELYEDFFCTQARPRTRNGINDAVLGRIDRTNSVYEDSESIRR